MMPRKASLPTFPVLHWMTRYGITVPCLTCRRCVKHQPTGRSRIGAVSDSRLQASERDHAHAPRVSRHPPDPRRLTLLPRNGRSRSREGQLRRRLLLVHGAAVRGARRRGVGHSWLYRRVEGQPDVRGGLGGRDWARRVDRGRLRPRQGELREAARRVLAQRRPDDSGRTVLRSRAPVPPRHLLPRRDAAPSRRGIEAGAGGVEEAAGPDRDRDRRRRAVLPGGGVPPGLLQEEPDPVPLLSLPVRAGSPARGGLGIGTGALSAVARRRLTPRPARRGSPHVPGWDRAPSDPPRRRSAPGAPRATWRGTSGSP